MLAVPEAPPCAVSQHPEATEDRGVSSLQSARTSDGAEVALLAVPGADAAMQESQRRRFREVRCEGNRVPIPVSECGIGLGAGESGRSVAGDVSGQDRQQQALRTWESALGDTAGELEQHAQDGRPLKVRLVSEGLPIGALRGRDADEADSAWTDGRGDLGPMAAPIQQAEREVWDVLSAGPLQRFTCNGRLVHNCLLLDHSGNIVRFAESFADVYFNGLAALDAGEKFDKEIRKDEERPPRKCPSCGFEPCGKRCIRCGFEAKSVSLVEHEEGRAKELDILGHGRKELAATESALYAMIATHERGKSERRVERGRPPGNPSGATAHRFRELTGKWPPRSFDYELTPNTPATRALQGKLRSMEIAFAKSRKS